jgi:hypothetical protein
MKHAELLRFRLMSTSGELISCAGERTSEDLVAAIMGSVWKTVRIPRRRGCRQALVAKDALLPSDSVIFDYGMHIYAV